MNDPIQPQTTHLPDEDAKDLERLGYRQELNRNLSLFSNFAIAFSFISATTGIFSLFGYGLTTGGPAFIWSWPVVFIGQLLVALAMAEVASHYPIAGSIYQWGKHLVGESYGWMAGWIYLVALLATVAAVDFGGAPYVAQLLGLSASSHGVLVAVTAGMVLLQTVINILGVRLIAIINNIGMFAEVVAMIVLAGALFAVGVHHPVSFVFETAGTGAGGSYLPVFLAAMLTSMWVLYGFDSAGSLAEEVKHPRVAVPKAILSALGLTFVIGAAALLAFILGIPDLQAAMKSEVPLTYILQSDLGDAIANGFIIIAALAIFVCGTAVQATVSRLLFSLGRDRKIPGSKLWVHLAQPYETPVAALIFSGIVTILLSLSASAEAYIINVCVVGIYLAYLSVPLGGLIAKARGWQSNTSPWNLGGWSLPVHLLAACWGIFAIINLCWPRTPDSPWYINYSVPLLAAVVLVIGGLYYQFAVRPRALAMDGMEAASQETDAD